MGRHGYRILIVPILLLAVFCPPGLGQIGSAPSYVYPIFNSRGVRIDPGRFLALPFGVRADLARARLVGQIQAQGGLSNDIRVLVYKDQRVIYDSGQSRGVLLDFQLNESGNYMLVLSNTTSFLSAKVVWGYVNLLYYETDRSGAGTAPSRTTERYLIGQDVLARLYQALRIVEREKGTNQIASQPRLGISSEAGSNPATAAGRNTVWINRESFEVAEASGNQEADLLAGVIGHELAHLFYRRQGGSHNSSLWDELRGALILSPELEQEVDQLGVRLACLAGFNPAGASLWMRLVIERYGDHSGVLLTQSQTSTRLAYIEQEAWSCTSTPAILPLGQEGSTAEESGRVKGDKNSGPPQVSVPEETPRAQRRSIEDVFASDENTDPEGRPKPQRKNQESTAEESAKSEPQGRPKLQRRNQATTLAPSPEATPAPRTQNEPEGRPTLRHKSGEAAREKVNAETSSEQSQAASTAPNQSARDTAPLKIISKDQPEYTEEARRRGIKGKVILSAVFTLEGQVTDIRVIKSLPYGLTEKAIEAAKRIRFEPAVREGQPMSIRTKVEFEFNP